MKIPTADFLRGLAQNDYMIDGQYLEDGMLLIEAANDVERLEGRDDTPRGAMLREVVDITNERGRSYGPPAEHFARTIGMINALYGTSFKPEDWPKMMILDKLARDAERPKDDNCKDIAGYAGCLFEVRRGIR
jgi:hypothetical protein